MKKLLIVAFSLGILQSCSNNGGESGAQNDGFNGAADSNGGLADTTHKKDQSATDTSKMEHRVDLSKRDTFNKQ